MTDKIIQTSTGDHGLNIMNTLKKIILTAAIQLRKDIVQKQNRFIMNDLLHQINLRKFQGKSCCSLLPLRTIFADINSVHSHHQVIPVRSGRSHFHPKIPVSVAEKALFQSLTLHAWFIYHFYILNTTGKISVNFLNDLIKGLHKFSSFANDLTAIIYQLRIPYIQSRSKIRSLIHILQQLISLIQNMIVSGKICEV